MGIIQRLSIILMVLIGSHHPLMAQRADSTRWRPSFGVDYTSELQTDFKRTKFVNLLELHADLPLSRHLSVNLSSISVATTDEEPLGNDLQGFSNIDSWNKVFALSVAGLTWQVNDAHSLFAGLRRIDEDYFCSDALSFFANCSCGGFPTITYNYLIPTYPLSAVGLHYKYDHESLCLQASVYNGVSNQDFTGRENVFRINPEGDGVFALAQAEYRHHDSHYFLGGSLHNQDILGLGKRKLRPSVWAYAEQALTSRLTLLAAYSHAFNDDALCDNFYAIGGKYTFKRVQLGIFSDHTRIADIAEWATELACNVTINDNISVQPMLHIMTTDGHTDCIGALRLNVSL